MVFYEHDWDRMMSQFAPEVSSLWFLRGLRDRLAEYLVEEAEYYVGKEGRDEDFGGPEYWAEQMITYIRPQCGYEVFRNLFSSRDRFETAKQARLLLKICTRIADLERRACGVPPGKLRFVA